MNIIEVQTNIINSILALGYTNVKDNLLVGITEKEVYPIVVVDLNFSETVMLASGGYTPNVHYLLVSVYQKVGIIGGTSQAREDSISALNVILTGLHLNILENKIQYVDTVISNIKVCGAGAIVEIGAY